MTAITQEELARLAGEANEKIREVLLPFMKAGVDVNIVRVPEDQFYVTKFTVPDQPDLHYEILYGIPAFEGRPCGQLPIFRELELPNG